MKVSQLDLDFEGNIVSLVYRPNTTDIAVFRTIFELDCYKLDGNIDFPPAMKSFKPKFIIDGGANVGYASVYFANRYPESERIIAIEPEIENFEMLKYNSQRYPQIEPIHAALWSRETDLSVALGELHKTNDAFITSEFSNETDSEITRGITIGKIFRESGFNYIDILKLDVEGAEKEIFSEEGNYQEWLPFVKVLIIELHDRMKRDCSRNFFRAISWYKSFFAFRDENLIFIREDLL